MKQFFLKHTHYIFYKWELSKRDQHMEHCCQWSERGERANERTNERTNQRTNERASEYVLLRTQW